MKQVHPVEDIGISPWPVDVVEFGADAYAHRKQVCIRQLYNQVQQTAWVSQFELVSSSQFSSSRSCSQLGTRCQRENQLADWGLEAFSDPRLSSPARMRKKCCYGQKNFGSIYSSLSPSPTHLSHTTNTNPFATLSRIKWQRYIFIKKCVRSFIEVVHYCWQCFRLYLYLYIWPIKWNAVSSRQRLYRYCYMDALHGR